MVDNKTCVITKVTSVLNLHLEIQFSQTIYEYYKMVLQNVGLQKNTILNSKFKRVEFMS